MSVRTMAKAEIKKEQVKSKVKKLLIDKKQFLQDQKKDKDLQEQTIDQSLLSAVASRSRGGLMSENDQRKNALQLVFLLLVLDDWIPPTSYDQLVNAYCRPGKDENARLAMANATDGETESRHRTLVRRHIQTAQTLVRAEADGDLGHGTLSAIEDYIMKRLNDDPKYRDMNIGRPDNPMSSAEIVAEAIRSQGGNPADIRIKNDNVFSKMLEINVNAAIEVASANQYSRGPSTRAAHGAGSIGSPTGYGPSTRTAKGTIDSLKKQGDQLNTALNWWNNFDNQLTLALGTVAGVGTALNHFKNGVSNAFTRSVQFTNAAARALNRHVPGLKTGGVNGGASESIVPLAVIAALGLGGTFAFRKYLRHRRNIQLARKLATDKAFMAEIDKVIRESGMDSLKRDKNGKKAIHELEQAELKGAPYMKGR